LGRDPDAVKNGVSHETDGTYEVWRSIRERRVKQTAGTLIFLKMKYSILLLACQNTMLC